MKPPRKFIVQIIKKRRTLGIQELTPLPDDKPVETLPTAYADGIKGTLTAKPKGKQK